VATALGYDRNIDTYLEVGKKRTFAGALDWPGWSRSGKTRDEALQALVDYGERYERVVRSAKVGFKPPTSVSQLKVKDELDGDTSTDFGVPGMAPKADDEAVGDKELERLQAVLKACWKAFDAAVQKARGKELEPAGPRGGGRDLDKIVGHVVEADGGYLAMIGRPLEKADRGNLTRTRKKILDGLADAAHLETPTEGPKGGKRWNARYFTRRVAWHVLDHAWEIEDRLG
jgi:hypothetical protein